MKKRRMLNHGMEEILYTEYHTQHTIIAEAMANIHCGLEVKRANDLQRSQNRGSQSIGASGFE